MTFLSPSTSPLLYERLDLQISLDSKIPSELLGDTLKLWSGAEKLYSALIHAGVTYRDDRMVSKCVRDTDRFHPSIHAKHVSLRCLASEISKKGCRAM